MNAENGGDALFRREAVEARGQGWLGGISLAQPLPLRVLASFAVAGALLLAMLLLFGDYTRRSRVAGQLVPDLGLVTVVAPAAGVVTGPLPGEGVQVERGLRLAVIATPHATTQGGDMTVSLLERIRQRQDAVRQSFSSQMQLLDLQADGSKAQLAAARLELEQIEAALAIERKQVRIARELLSQVQQLAAQGHLTRQQLTQQEQAALEREADMQSLERQATSVRRQILDVEQGLRELANHRLTQEATRARELAELDQERLRIQAGGEVLVAAPISGLVASRLVELGQAVSPGQPLLTLLPAGSVLQARLLVPSRAIGFINPGDAVRLRYPAYPHQKFGHQDGRVLSISRNALDPRAISASTGQAAGPEPSYRVVVELAAQSIVAYGSARPLRPGMAVEADIMGERRQLYEWLLEPLYSLTGKL